VQVVGVGEGSIIGSVNGTDINAPNCVNYCTDFSKYCDGLSTMYPDMETCLFNCSTFPMGVDGETDGNSLSCRWHHLHVEGGAAAEHCPHASYAGTGHCFGVYDFVPSISVNITSSTDSAATIQSELQTALASYDVETVTVTETNPGQFIATVQFQSTTAGEAASDEFLSDDKAFQSVLDSTDLTVESSSVLFAQTAPTSISTNTVVAAVMLPMALLAIFAGLYFSRTKISNCFTAKASIDVASAVPIYALVQACSTVLLIVLLAVPDWAQSGVSGVDFGLFEYCDANACNAMTSFDPNAASVLEAAQTFVLFTFLGNLAGAVLAFAMHGGYLSAADSKYMKMLFVLAGVVAVSVFLSLCLYAAFYYDVISQAYPSASIGWALDLMGVYFLAALACTAVSFRLLLATGGNTQAPTTTV
jgi:hypothetical protein